jgi:hypothetical protein
MLEIKFDYIMFPSDVRCTEQEFISAHLCTALHGNISKTHSVYGYLFDPKGTKGQKNCVAWGVWQNFLAVVILTSLPQLAWDKRLCYCGSNLNCGIIFIRSSFFFKTICCLLYKYNSDAEVYSLIEVLSAPFLMLSALRV